MKIAIKNVCLLLIDCWKSKQAMTRRRQYKMNAKYWLDKNDNINICWPIKNKISKNLKIYGAKLTKNKYFTKKSRKYSKKDRKKPKGHRLINLIKKRPMPNLPCIPSQILASVFHSLQNIPMSKAHHAPLPKTLGTLCLLWYREGGKNLCQTSQKCQE